MSLHYTTNLKKITIYYSSLEFVLGVFNISKIDGLVNRLGAAVGAVSALVPRKKDEVGDFLQETRNPYIANLVVSIANNERSTVSVEDAIDIIEDGEGIDRIVELLSQIHVANVSSGGGSRGFYYVGQHEELVRRALSTSSHFGTSIGAVAATMDGLRMQPYASDIDVSPDAFRDLANRLGDSLSSNGSRIRGLLGEAFLDSSPMVEVLRGYFGVLKVNDVEGLHIIASNMSTGARIIYNSYHNGQSIDLVDALEQTTAFPYAFNPVRINGTVIADGGFHALPLRLAFEAGADLVLATALNYRIKKGQNPKYSRIRGKINLGFRIFEVMQHDATEEAFIHLTGRAPEEIAEHGDPNGRIILGIPDLSKVLPFRFNGSCRDLPELGKQETSRLLEKFLSPGFVHPDYNSTHFLQQYQNATRN